MIVHRPAPLLASLALAAACAHAPPVATPLVDALVLPAPDPQQARAEAQRLGDPIAAIDMTWILGNDRAAARAMIEAALRTRPRDPALLWRRARLAEAELRERDSRADLIAIIGAAPASPEAALAIARLSDSPGDTAAERSDTQEAARAALLGPALLAPSRVVQLALLYARSGAGTGPELDPAIAERAGLVTAARTLGPIGPRTVSALRVPSRPELEGIDAPAPLHRGQVAQVRAAFSSRGDLLPVEGALDGVYVLESYLTLPAKTRVALGVDLRAYGRVRIDGADVLDRAAQAPIPPAVETLELELDAGPHRISVTFSAGRSDAVRLSILGTDGRPLPARATAVRPTGLPPPRPLLARTLPSDLARALDDCPPITRDGELCVPHIARDPWSARALLADLALSRATRDIERARPLVRGLLDAAPRSATALMLDARLSAIESLPSSRSEAALRMALREDPNHPGLLLAVARQLEQDEPDAAMALVDRARAAVPGAVEPELARFRLLRNRGWYAEASMALHAVLARSRGPGILEEAARHERTLVHLQAARALETELEAALPTDARAIGHALQRGDVDDAIKRLTEAASDRVRPAEVWRQIGELELGRARPGPALQAARRALESEPSDPAAHRTALVAARNLGQLDVARQHVGALRALGAADVELELYAADLDQRTIGAEPEGSWLAERLRIDPRALATAPPEARWSGASRVRVLDRIVEHVRPDGSTLSHHHELTRLQDKDATDVAGEIRLSGGALPLTLRTLKPDGRAIEVDRHAGKADLSFSALAPGDTVEKEWIVVSPPVSAFGGYLRRFLFQTDLPSARAELAVVVPKGQQVWWKSYHGAPEPEVHEDGATRTYYFAARDVPGIPAEPAMAPIEEFLPFVVVAVGLDEASALEANRSILGPIARPSREVTTVTASITRGASSAEGTLTRISRWVDAHVREGGGDATRALLLREGPRLGLITAMARAAGLDAKLVLAHSGRDAHVSPPYPNPGTYDDLLVRVDLPEGRRWVDAHGPILTVGKAPPHYLGGAYVVVDPPADGVQPFAPEEIAQWQVQSRAQLALDAAGDLSGTIQVTFPSALGATVRETFRPLRPEDIARGLQGWVGGFLPGVELVNVTHSDLATAADAFVMTVSVRGSNLLGDEDGARVFRRFFEGPVGLRALGVRPLEAYLSRSQRQMPMSLDASAERLEVEVRIDPALGSPVDPPASFTKSTPWASVTQQFEWDASTHTARLALETETRGTRVSPEEYPAFRAMAQEVTLRTRNRLVLRAAAP